MPKQLLEKAKKVADHVQIYWLEEDVIPVKFKNSLLQKVFRKKNTHINLTIIKDGKSSTIYGTSFKDADIMVDQAVKSLEYGQTSTIDLPSKSPGQTRIYDKSTAGLSAQDLIGIGNDIIKKSQKYNKNNYQFNLLLSKEINKVGVMNSNGLEATYSQTPYYINMGTPIPNSTTDIVVDDVYNKYFDCKEEWLEALFIRRNSCKQNCSLPTDKMSVIFQGDTVGAIMFRLMEGVSGASIEQGISPLIDKLDQQVFSKEMTIEDDPTLDWEIDSVPFDAEGVATKKKTIIQEGILKNYIFDLHNAKKMGVESTGNGFRKTMFQKGFSIPVTPFSTNFIVKPGKTDEKEMIKDIKQGVLIDMVIGMHSGNIVQGQYSMNIGLGYVIKNGKIQGRIQDAMVAGNIYEDFKNVVNMSNKLDRNFLGRSPAIHFKDISIACK